MKKLEAKIKNAKTSIRKFKILVTHMYRGFPNYAYPTNFVEWAIKSNIVREELVADKFFMRGKLLEEDRDYYGLAPSALPLISSWRMERLTFSLWILTSTTIILMIWQIYNQVQNNFLLYGMGVIEVIVFLTIYFETKAL